MTPTTAAGDHDDTPDTGASGALRVGSRVRDFPATELLRSRRLTLRQFCARDLQDLLRLGQEPRVGEFLLDEPVSSLGEVCAFIQWINAAYVERPGLGIWHASTQHSGFVGFFSLMPEPETADIGIGARLLPSTWGRGYALEGTAALCGHAFDTLRLPRLIGLCDTGNRSVPPILGRLGFQADGDLTRDGKRALRFLLRREAWTGIRLRARKRAGRGTPAN